MCEHPLIWALLVLGWGAIGYALYYLSKEVAPVIRPAGR
jgi:hypothetical protein